jgi:hypothetical protein
MVIQVDDFFKGDLLSLIAKGTQTYDWRYNHKSDLSDPNHNKFFVSHLWNVSSQDNFFSMLWGIIKNNVQSISDCTCWRIIANGQIKGQDGNWHTDHGDKTVLYFPLSWDSTWGGSTYFRIKSTKKKIEYRQNRLVVFDSDVLHYGSAPLIENILRISIAFNLRVEN